MRSIYSRIFLAIILASLTAGLQPTAAEPVQVELERTPTGLTVARAKESFSTLSLEGSDLRPDPPLSAGQEKTPEFVREMVRLQWRPNDPIDLYVILPPQVKSPPVVLYLYSYPATLDRFRDKAYCQRLVKNGAAAVGFLSARTGYRGEQGPLKKWFVSELPESLATTVHDVQLILNYLATRGDLDMSRVGIFGQGSGGAIAILSAFADPRLKALDLLNPWGDWPDWLAQSPVVPEKERGQYLSKDFCGRLEPLEPLRYLPALKSRAMRIQFWDDETAPTKGAVLKLETAAPRTAKIAHYSNGRAMYAESSNGRLFEWIATALKSSTEAKQAAAKTPPAPSDR